MTDLAQMDVTNDGDALRIAAHLGNVDRCRELLDSGFPVDQPHFWTPLRSACAAGHANVARVLIDAGARVGSESSSGAGFLKAAIGAGSLESCKVLLDAGVSVSGAGGTDLTPLMEAAKRDHAAICQLLIDHGADIHAAPSGEWPPLHLAAGCNSLEATKVLIAAGADPSIALAGHKEPPLTAFQLALRYNAQKVIRYFLFERGEDLAQRTLGGATMLQLASKHAEVRALIRSIKTGDILDGALDERSASAGSETQMKLVL